MLIKLGIIGAILIIGGFIFSSEINELFPSTSASVLKTLGEDVGELGSKTSKSVEKKIDTSITEIVDNTTEKINNEISDAKKSSKTIVTDELTKINPIESIENIFSTQSETTSIVPESSNTLNDSSPNEQNTLNTQPVLSNSNSVHETLSLSTIQQPDGDILLNYEDSTGKTQSVNVTIRTLDREIFSGTFYAPIFETTINDVSANSYYIDMIVEHEEYGTVTSSVFNSGEHSGSVINGIFS